MPRSVDLACPLLLQAGLLVLSASVYSLSDATVTGVDLAKFEQLAKAVNDANTSWTADLNLVHSAPHFLAYLKSGLSLNPHGQDPTQALHVRAGLEVDTSGIVSGEEGEYDFPGEFDLRKQYPMCTNIGHMWIQSNCGSCWAVAATGAMSDRMCIATEGRLNHLLSADHMMTCCPYCINPENDLKGCDGGDPLRAWLYMKKQGVPSGGDYASHQGCKPYSVAPCNLPGYQRCQNLTKSSLVCSGNRCSNQFFRTPFWDNLFFGKSAYEIAAAGIELGSYSLQEAIMKYEIFHYGSIVAAITMYEDLAFYRRGVYQHIKGESQGGHAIKIIGWGEENNVPYWLFVNSWSKYWGQSGIGKIRRGFNESAVESLQVSAGLFDSERSCNHEDFVYDMGISQTSALRETGITLCVLLWSLLFCLQNSHC